MTRSVFLNKWISLHLKLFSLIQPCLQMLHTNTTIGQKTLESRGLNFDGYLYWISLGALFGFALVINIGFVLALTFLQRNFPFLFFLISRTKSCITVP